MKPGNAIRLMPLAIGVALLSAAAVSSAPRMYPAYVLFRQPGTVETKLVHHGPAQWVVVNGRAGVSLGMDDPIFVLYQELEPVTVANPERLKGTELVEVAEFFGPHAVRENGEPATPPKFESAEHFSRIYAAPNGKGLIWEWPVVAPGGANDRFYAISDSAVKILAKAGVSNTVLAQGKGAAPIKLYLADWLHKEFVAIPGYHKYTISFDATPLGKMLSFDTLVADGRQIPQTSGISDLSRQVAFAMNVPIVKLMDTFKCEQGTKFCKASEDMVVQIGEPVVVENHATIVYQIAEMQGNQTYQQVSFYRFVMDLERAADGTWKSQRVRRIEGAPGRATGEIRPLHSGQ